MGRYGKWVRYIQNCARPQYSPGLPGRLDLRAARGERGWRPQHWKLRNVPRNLRTVMMLVASVGPTVLPVTSSEEPDPRIPPQRDLNWNETRYTSVQEKDPANFEQLSWGTRKRRRRKPKARSTSLEKIGEPVFGKQGVHVTSASGSHLAGKERPVSTVNTHTLVVECGPVKPPDGEGATTTAVVSFRVDKQNLPEPTEDCAMPDDYTEPAIPRTQDKQCQSLAKNPGLPTGTPVTKIGSSFEELRYYKIPKIKQQVPPTKERGSYMSRTYPVSPMSKKQRVEQDKHSEEYSSSPSSSPAVSTSSSALVDKIMKDMDKAYPKVSGCYVSCSNRCPLRNEVDEFPKSPSKCPLEENQSLSKSAIFDCAPVSSQIKQKIQMKICTVCKRKNVSEGVGQGTCVRCSLCEQINKEQAAMKEQGRKERLAVCEPVVPAKLPARRSSSDVENKEMVVSIPIRPRSRSKSKTRTTNADTMSSASLQANEHENIFRKRKRKTYLTKPIISSSDDSSNNEDDVCVVAASADGASLSQSEQARPQRKCRALSENPQNITEEPPRKGFSEISEKPLTTGSKNSKAESKLRRMQSKKAKPKVRLMQGKGSEEEKLRRQVMKKAWKNAKDTEDYLRTLGELEKCTKKRKTLCKIAKKSEEPEKIKSRNNGHTDAKPALGEHEQLGSVNDEHTDVKPTLKKHEQLESVKGDCTDAKGTLEEREQLESVMGDHTDVKPTLKEHEQIESVKGDRTDARGALEECEQLESVNGDHTNAELQLEKHEQFKSDKGDHTDSKSASAEQSGEVAIDISRLASDSLVSASSPALVVASCCSLSLTDWEGMANESVDSFNSEVVGSEVSKVTSAYSLPSDGSLSDIHAPTSSRKCAEKAVLPSAVVTDPSAVRFNGKRVDAAMKCLMGLPFLLSFEDDGAMSVTIRDSGGVSGREKGFPAKEVGGLMLQPQEVGTPSSSDADNVSAFTASLQEGGFNFNQGQAVRKSHLDKEGALTDTHTRKKGTKILAEKPGSSKQEEPVALSASALPPSPCGNSNSGSHITADICAPSGRDAVCCNFNTHVVDCVGTVDSGNKDTSPVIPTEPNVPLTQPTEDTTEACVNIPSAAQGASRSGSVSSLEARALSRGQLMLSEAAYIKSLGTNGTENGPLPNSMDLPSPTDQSVCATINNMNVANTTSSCTAVHNIEQSCLTNTGVTASGTDWSLLSAIESMELFCRKHFMSKESVQSGYLQCDEHLASRVAQLQLDSSHTDSSCVHPTHANGHSSRNALPQNSWDSRHTARSVWPSAGNIGSPDSNASCDISLVDTVLVISRAAIGTTDKGHAGQGGVLCQLLEEYVQNIERFLVSLSECTPGYRDELVSTMLPNGIVGLKTIVQLVWRMEAELQCLGRDRVSDLDKGIFSLLMEQADSLSKTTTEQDLPAFMTIEVCIEPQLPTLADTPGQAVADDEQHTNCNEVLEHHTKSNRAADVTLEAVGQLWRAEASPVPVASSVDCCVTKNADDDAIIIVDDADQEGQMTDALAASPQRTITGVQRNRMQRLGSISVLRQPSETVSGKGEMASQPKSLQAATVDVAVQGTAHTTATVDVSPLEQGQLSMGMTCTPHAATGIVQNRVPDEILTAKPKNLDAVLSTKVSQAVNAKEAPRVPTDAAVAVAATLISSSDKHRLPSTEKAVEPGQQRWDQGPKTAHSVNQHSVLNAGSELNLTMQSRQQPDRSALRSPLKCPRANVSDTCSTAQQSSQAPKRKVAKVSSQQAISQGIQSNQNSRQGQLAHSGAGKPQQGRQVHAELRDPPPLIYAGPQHTGQNEKAFVQQSVMNSKQREELAKQVAWLNARAFPRNLQGSAGPPYSTAEQFHVPPDWVRRTGQPSGDASRPVHAQGFSPQSELLQGSSNTHTQLQEREPCLLQQHVRGQQYAANTNAPNFLPAPSASYGSRVVPMDAALIEAEREVLDQLQMQRYLNQIVHKFKAGEAAPVQQPGHSEAPERRQLSQREMRLRQQINNALHAFTISASQKAQQWRFRACQSYQQPLQHPTAELSYDSSAQARVDMNNRSAGISEESTSLESPSGFVRPWTGESKWPEPYAACQDALQRWKNRQLDGEPKTGVPGDAVEQGLDEYRVAANAHPRQTMEAQNHVLMHQVSVPEPNRNIAQSDISDHAPVRHTAVSGRKWNTGARFDVSCPAPVREEVSVPQQSRNFVAGSGVSGRTHRERSTSTWHPPTSIHHRPVYAEVSSSHLAEDRGASSPRLPSQQISREGLVLQPVPGELPNLGRSILPQ